MLKTILYYTCNTHPPEIEARCRNQLKKSNLPIISVALNEPIKFGITRLLFKGERSPLMMHRQVVGGLRVAPPGVIYLCESDVLYHPAHFQFEPPRPDTFYFNTNVYKRWPDGHTVWTDDLRQLSGMCGDRDLLLEFFEKRLTQIETEGFNRHYEPGARYNSRVKDWQAECPNLDLRHDGTLTRSHRQAEEFRNQRYARGFRVVDHVPYWDE